MLTAEQEKWIGHLSNTDTIKIVPFDPTAESRFQEIKQLIQEKTDRSLTILHLGASGLGISGQDEIDVYIPIKPAQFNTLIPKLKNLFGEPRSSYPLERSRFATAMNGKHIDIFLINQDSAGWQEGQRFHAYLLSHPLVLETYRQLKENSDGVSVQEYYRRKIEFINAILEKTK